MHITGLKFPAPSPQCLEVLIVLKFIPSMFLGRIITPIHGLAILLPPLIYVSTLVLNRFKPPEWMARFAFSAEMLDPTWRNMSRVVACATSLTLRSFEDCVFKHLGDQWHTIGHHEKPRVVKTSPYAWVRHPEYSSVLLQEALWSIMFWSYVPLVALGGTAFAFAVKMQIEESLIQKDDAIRAEYWQYMTEVPARIFPYVW
ncbi:hypothetical protein HD554DRAFT_2300241 [Boletus coccyginus]|nr:hypothetical protein HD554DRAFT_2300241 [Boletus coccyginus]